MKNAIILVSFIYLVIGCNSPIEPETYNLQTAEDLSIEKLLTTTFEVSENQYPIFTDSKAKWVLTNSKSWTSGFYPGCL